MFGLGMPELIIIFVIALVVFGPKKLPDLGKSIGRAMAGFRKGQEDFKETVQGEMREVEKTAGLDEVKKHGRFDDLSAYRGADTVKVKPAQTTGQDGRHRAGEDKGNV